MEDDIDLDLNEPEFQDDYDESDSEIEWLTEIQYKDGQGDNHLYFGNYIVGVWQCNCRRLFPRQLEELFDKTAWTRSYNMRWSNKKKLPPIEEVETDESCSNFVCLKCKSNFVYDEEA